jgi:hypothetical protein
MRVWLVTVTVLVAASGRADAYPQFQLVREQTCRGCHISPAGGGLLTEEGFITAEEMSQFGTTPEFFYGKITTPTWLKLGGDFRGMTGYIQTPEKSLISFPMQAELYANAQFGDFSIHVNGGLRPGETDTPAGPNNQKIPYTYVMSREHYVEWQPDAEHGGRLYLRAGRFMPVFGLRLAEHDDYIRRYGGTALFTDTYGVAAEFVDAKWDAHVTGFIADPFIDFVGQDSGGAAYVELRPTPNSAVGAEGMITRSPDDKKFRGGVTAKYYIPTFRDIVLQGELQFLNQRINGDGAMNQGGAPNQLIGYLLGTIFLTDPIMLDVGFGYYNENIRIAHLDRDCVDLNLHWFTTSHIELILNTRVEFMSFGAGGPTGAYAFLQGHYRL